MFGLVRGAAII